MSRKVVGLDIGSHSIKAVLARERLGKIDLLQFHERPATKEGIEETIRAIFREKGMHPDIVVSSVSGNTVSVHYLQIPFSDEAKISQVIPFEVESTVPFPLEEMIIDQFIVSRGNGTPAGNGSSVCVALIKKSILQNHLDTLKEAYVDPRIIELESLALYHAFMQWYRTDETVALFDIGAARSNLCIVSKGKPRSVRTFNRGGNDITSAIQNSLAISFEEAEQKKISTGILYETATEGEVSDREVISNEIKRGLGPLLTELQQSLRAYEIQHNDPIMRMYIAGGGTRLLNIERMLNDELGRDVEHLSVPKDVLQKLSDDKDAEFIIPTVLGLALRGIQKKTASGLNFRKGEYFHRKETKEKTGKLLYLIIAVLAVILLGSADFYFRSHYTEARYKSIRSEIRKVYLDTFPGAKNIVDEGQQFKSAVDDLKKKISSLGGGKDKGVTSLELLTIITEKIPKEVSVNIDDLLIDKAKIKVQGETESFQNVEKIKKEFETIPLFKKVDVGDAKLSADQKKVKFRIIADM